MSGWALMQFVTWIALVALAIADWIRHPFGV